MQKKSANIIKFIIDGQKSKEIIDLLILMYLKYMKSGITIKNTIYILYIFIKQTKTKMY